ncbi:response regulator [Pelagicoccus albus]|uniref:histidine kinase n=1 Tax=Pelagicoccus albus TaxID=415222 RepID=A0A7X1B8M8_9BACT|nr:response regulator [Pelagicoccus albus]
MISNSTNETAEKDLPPLTEVCSNLVLVIDDDRTTQGIVSKFLKQADYGTLAALRAEEARSLISEKKPELILCDVNMPGEDGITLCQRLKSDEDTSDIPIIIFTGSTELNTMSRAFEAGANDYVVKPIRKAELLTRCKRQIEEFRARNEAKRKINTLHKQNTSKTRFLSVASHDLRNPLASIRGISQYLDGEKFGTLNESQKEMVRCIIDASENMLTLVEDLLDVSKIELDHFDLSKEQLAPAALMEQTCLLQQPAAEKKSIAISHTDSTDGALASIDKRLIMRTIENLVTNAIKFSPRETEIRLETRFEDQWIALSVKDGGPGIPEDEFDKLFREFSRTSNMPTAGESTSGIGLYVVKRIVTSHGGEISVENRPEGGAHFKIKLKRIP